MRIKLFLLALLLTATLSVASCAPKAKVTVTPGQSTDQTVPPVSKGDELLKDAKAFGKALTKSLDEGIRYEAALAQDGVIDPDKEPQIRQWLQDGKTATDDFNARIAKYEHFDAASRADVAKFLDDAIGFIDNLEQNGILRIKNPNSRIIARSIISGARLLAELYKSKFEEAQ